MPSEEPGDHGDPRPGGLTRRRLLLGTAALGFGALAGGVALRRDDSGATLTSGAPTTTEQVDLALRLDPEGVLDLPEGFEYRVVAREGDALVDGGAVPGRFDGMGAFESPDGGVALVRNHELSVDDTTAPVLPAPAALTYDRAMPGGTVTVVLDRDGRLLSQRASLGGTARNCAGGVTPWGTWLTCEEEELVAGELGGEQDHGWVFEVHPFDDEANRDPQPLRAMGRFAHEAVAVDPMTGDCYLTEDAEQPNGLFYRFEPTTRPGGLHTLRDGGRLSAMCVPGVADLSAYDVVGTELPVTWKEVPDPSALGELGSTRKQFSWIDRTTTTSPVAVERDAGEITRSHKLEGAWWTRDRVFFTASFAAPGGVDWSEGAHDGQVWSYDPGRSVLRLEAFFPVSADPAGATAGQVDRPDNITPSPWGGLFVATDGGGPQHLVSVDEGGRHVVFARNAANGSELCGVVLSPDGGTLFVNVLAPGRTFAITGPLERLRSR